MTLRASSLACLLGLGTLLALPAAQALAADNKGPPVRGRTPWVFLLCRFTDSPATPLRNLTTLYDLLVNPGNQGLRDYFSSVSRGAMPMANNLIVGYYTVQRTVEQVKAEERRTRFRLCVDAASAAGFTVPAGYSTAVVTHPTFDLWGSPGTVFLGVNLVLAAITHELGHGIGLQHSKSDQVDFKCGGPISEYHDFSDIMSYACETRSITTARFGAGGPGFNAFHLDKLGWLGRSEVLTWGADGRTSGIVTLKALYASGFGGTRLIRVPYDPSDLGRYYTVELRMRSGWDAALLASTIVIHDVRLNGPGDRRSYLQRARLNGPPATNISANSVVITVIGINATTETAQVQITSAMAGRCFQGYVWRDAGPADRVCVTPASRSLAAAENALGPSRRSPTGGPFGPDTCLQGYVWREAFAGDRVCVPVEARTRVASENAAGGNLVNPARAVYGPNACLSGFVWREADDRDYVCVTPATRSTTRWENILANSRRSPTGGIYGPNTCLPGYVWREAFNGDFVCVPAESRARARTDNAAAADRRVKA